MSQGPPPLSDAELPPAPPPDRRTAERRGPERRADLRPGTDRRVVERRELAETRAEIRRRLRRSLLTGGITAAAFAAAFRFLDRADPVGMLRRPFRAAEDLNGQIAQHLIGETHLAPTYPASRAVAKPTALGPVGIRKDLDPSSWRMQLTGLHAPERHPNYVRDVTNWRYRYHPSFALRAEAIDQLNGPPPRSSGGLSRSTTGNKLDVSFAYPSAPDADAPADPDALDYQPAQSLQAPPSLPSAPGLLLTLAQIQALPFVEQTTEFKCIEGWSEIMTFGGVRFRDFLEAYPPARNPDGSLPKYAAMTTPDGSYYCGFEIEALLHPQTLLCFRMSRKELTPDHGAPLRLAMPIKYGYKQIKQIARITYTNQKPEDYWANLAYDWHGGL